MSDPWQFLHDTVAAQGRAALLLVADSQGSSPGRQGFKMAVAPDGSMTGSIGGGIMEHKLVELLRERLRAGEAFCELRHQIHRKDVARDQSGMICSGEQWIVLRSMDRADLSLLAQAAAVVAARSAMRVVLDPTGWRLEQGGGNAAFVQGEAGHWQYAEPVVRKRVAHVVGAGHVGLAMCQVLALMDFHVTCYDDRPDLNTMAANAAAHEKVILPYPELGSRIASDPEAVVVIMTFGYRGDDEAVRALMGREFAYFGMMGSKAKVEKLLGDLRRDGFPESQLQALKTPAGLIPHCKTPSEIAISIAAEILSEMKNR